MAEDPRQRYLPHEWLDPRVEVRVSPVAGRGLFARGPIEQGQPVVVWGGQVFTTAEIQVGIVADRSTVPIGEGIYLGSPVGEYDRDRNDLGDLMNHSCDPTVWMRDEVTLVTRRPIEAGEELTANYVYWEDDEAFVTPFVCSCGASVCRHRITGQDWRRAELQSRYEGHFSPFINERIQRLRQQSELH